MKLNYIYLYIALFAFNALYAQISNGKVFCTIILKDIEYSKIPPKYDIFILSKVSKKRKKNFSSAIGGFLNKKYMDFPIDDSEFNYEFFSNLETDSIKRYKLLLREYTFKGKKYSIAIKIE